MASPVEVCFLIGAKDSILWADQSQSPVALPDSRQRWNAIWRHREELIEIAHSHPLGPPTFSGEDRTTMEALDLALGRPLRYSVVSLEGMIRSNEQGGERFERAEPWWASLLRAASGMNAKSGGRDPEAEGGKQWES